MFIFCISLVAEALCAKLEADARLNAEARSCTGGLAVHPRSRDIKIDNFSITFHGCELIHDTLLELSCGRRYGLLGLNGCGKVITFPYLAQYSKNFFLYLSITYSPCYLQVNPPFSLSWVTVRFPYLST